MDHHQHVRRVLLDRHPLAHDVLGQLGERDRHPVLHQHLGDIEIGSELEGDGEGEIAVAGRLGDHVEHVLDAVDLLLQRRGHALAHHLRRGAGVAGLDDDGRGGHLRILRHRQGEIGEAADQGDEDRDDGGEDRPVDEEMRKLHLLGRHSLGSSSGILPGSGVTLLPGRTRTSPSMMIVSPAERPLRTMRRLA